MINNFIWGRIWRQRSFLRSFNRLASLWCLLHTLRYKRNLLVPTSFFLICNVAKHRIFNSCKRHHSTLLVLLQISKPFTHRLSLLMHHLTFISSQHLFVVQLFNSKTRLSVATFEVLNSWCHQESLVRGLSMGVLASFFGQHLMEIDARRTLFAWASPVETGVKSNVNQSRRWLLRSEVGCRWVCSVFYSHAVWGGA
jgi:hypothetical protein